MKKEKAIPIMKKTGRAEGSRKELNMKTDPGELKEGMVNPGEGMVNPQYEERRLNEAIATLDEKYEDKYNQLQLEIQQNNKGKTSRVDSLLNSSSPFTERVMAIQLPDKFKIPAIQAYTGIKDPTEHLDNYKIHMDL
jgi:C4-type Zn-finger protein